MTALNTDKLKKAAKDFVTAVGAGGVSDNTVDTVSLVSVTGLPTDTAIQITIDRVDANGTSTPTKKEVITGVVSGGNLINCLRGVEGTAQAHSTGAVVEVMLTAAQWNDMIAAILVEHGQGGLHTKGPTSIAYTPAGAATATLDLSTGNRHKITMPAGNITIALSNETVGQVFMIEITQDGTGSRTVTWFTTIKWAGGSAPTLTTAANKRDAFGFVVTGAGTYDAYIIGQNI